VAAVLPRPEQWRVVRFGGPYVTKAVAGSRGAMALFAHQGSMPSVLGDKRPAPLPPVKGEPLPTTAEPAGLHPSGSRGLADVAGDDMPIAATITEPGAGRGG